ncbi:hypothetical protein [Anaeromyxobacter oryzae]|uniref:Uncharacterized protein n=1 Tax=Anaeromyxobacter oryzae TaxID=2918170 RepID=A0ABN6MY01_9BACT|nr:hypothetical protein [Anaeromyxobacter oryzae]BDG04438.1 hypothetical protein AMOR_34340 [Anaeromyxobacter oryzae]
MRHAPRLPRAQVIAMTRRDPILGPWDGWTPVVIALAVLLLALLGR